LGFFDGAVDGVFGTETEDAVKAAQQNFGLDADGVVGTATWDALLQ
jgi:N-acetylmuramoyl-L-alanine amidase